MPLKRTAFRLLGVVIYLLVSSGPVRADIKDLIMPGPVVAAHAGFEKDCRRCHAPFKKGEQRQLCLKCHPSVARDLDRKQGFHGRSAVVAGVECKHCHTEHKGRDADILAFDRETFNHDKTDFPLEESHRQVACASCHKPLPKPKPAADFVAPPGPFSRTAANCVSCHRSQEPHRGRLGEKCQQCHSARAWKKVDYSHTQGKFRLRGMHKKVGCVLCHPDQRWKKIATDCYSCHRLDDVHAGRYGQKCQECHDEMGPARDPQRPKSAWRQVRFDHARTKFPLTGKHRTSACELCHAPGQKGKKLPLDCFSCHQRDDQHRGFFGTKCESCHTTEGWKKASFDHQKTDFPLQGKHRRLPCERCHVRPVGGKKLGSACYGCHQLDDVHRNQENQRCERCHSADGWRQQIRFDHDLTRFPLLGLHAAAPCESCHTGANFRGQSLECVDCHRGEDQHKGTLGKACAACHTPNGWKLWTFDHNKPGGFPLEGAHRGLACGACHKTPVEGKIKLARTCAACHRDQDIHRGAFGRNCERCHQSESFKKLRNSPG